jgi:hypothetical integral membrane protein (TIGR02206 family)
MAPPRRDPSSFSTGDEPDLQPFSAEHLLTLAVVLALVGGVTTAARLRPGSWTTPVRRGLAVVLVVNEAGWWVWLWSHGGYTLDYALPLQLCDLACFAAAAALLTLRPLLVELTWFWGIAGSANSLVTPDLPQDFPDYLWFQYVIAHGAIVLAAVVLVVGLRIPPRPWAWARVFAITAGVLVVDAVVDLLTGGNYLFLRQPPAARSLLDLFGPWPWYVLGGSVLALVAFLILDLPFRVSRATQPQIR